MKLKLFAVFALIVPIAPAQSIPIPTQDITTCLPGNQTGPQLPACFARHGGNNNAAMGVGITAAVAAPVTAYLIRRLIARHRRTVEARAALK